MNSFELSKHSTLLKETLFLFWRRRKKQFLVKQVVVQEHSDFGPQSGALHGAH